MDWKYLPGHIKGTYGKDWGRFQTVLALAAVTGLLLFAWCAPVIQHFRLRSKADDGDHSAT
jgi:hypothetical protein